VTGIVVALAVSGVVLTRYAASYHAQRSVAVGDHLANRRGCHEENVRGIFSPHLTSMGNPGVYLGLPVSIDLVQD
jgi:hypothetical protein